MARREPRPPGSEFASNAHDETCPFAALRETLTSVRYDAGMNELAASTNPNLFTGTLAYATPPRFDPEQGRTILEPPGSGYGYWAGAPSAVYDPGEDRFYTYYRLRSPRTKGRGG